MSPLKTGRPVLVLAGPTASGKSTIAIAIADQTGGTIINADAMQLYAELSIFTARPDAAALARAPHRLYGVSRATDIWSAARWRNAALEEIAAASGLPILVGGTGLYLRALLQGFSRMPPVPQEFRRAAEARRAEIGAAAFHAEVGQFDAAVAARFPASDRQRLIRAWEVFRATGRPLSAWQEEPLEGPPPGLAFATVLLDPPRAALHEAIDDRVQAMVAAGGVDELAAVEGLDPALPLLKAVGVPEFLSYRCGEIDLTTATARAQAATRQYAKRQATWFRHQIMADLRVTEQYYYENEGEIFRFIRSLS